MGRPFHYRTGPRKLITKKQSREINQFLNHSEGPIIKIIGSITLGLFSLLWLSLFLTIFLLIFLTKVIVKIIKKKKGVFSLSQTENRILGFSIRPLRRTWEIMKIPSKRFRTKNYSYNNKGENYCEVCGSSLRSRKKYCSNCRPTYKRKPLDSINLLI